MRRTVYSLILLISGFLAFLHFDIRAEGTKEIYPAGWGNYKFYLSTQAIRNDFALYGCTPEERLNIEIAEEGEIIYFGFNDGPNTTNFNFRIIDPYGNIAYPQTQIPTSGPGYINDITEARIGPNTLYTGGYEPMMYVSEYVGTHYIEFDYGWGDKEFEFLDITVADPTATDAMPGRLWSKAWQLTTTGAQQQCGATMVVYTEDQIATSVDFNGMRPYAFDISCNQTGCAQTGNFLEDRKSRPGRHLYPQYKIFLNDPDSNIFPTGVLGQIDSIDYDTDCDGNVEFTIWVNKKGNAEILLDIYPPAGYNEGDVKLPTAVLSGSAGNSVSWNGLDGYGVPVENGTNIDVTVSYLNGLTHLPLYDAEYSMNYNPHWTGYIMELVRPSGPQPAVFWNDSLCGGGANFDGCISATGCHTWNYNQGNEKTINTWWYAVSTSSAPVTIIKKQHMTYDSLVDICQGDSLLIDGVYQKTTGNYPIVHTSILTGCDSTEIIHLTVNPRPALDLGPDVWICEGFTHEFDAGAGTGYTYQWDNISTGTPNIATTQTYTTGTEGYYRVTVNNTYDCPSKDSVNLFVNPKPELTNSPMEDTICSHSTFTVDLTSTVPSTDYSWIPTVTVGNITGATAGSGTQISHTLINTDPTNSVVKYTITPVSGGCYGDDTTYTVVVKPKPEITTTPLTYTLCSPDTLDISLISPVAGVTFGWIATASSSNVTGFADGTGDLIHQGLTNTGYTTETVTYKAAAAGDGCDGDTVTFVVTLHPKADLTTTPLLHAQCNNLSTGITLTSNVSGTLFSWEATASSPNLSGQANSVTPGTSIDQTIVNSGYDIDTVYYEIVPHANGCSGDTSMYKVAVYPTPDLTNTPLEKQICSENSTNLPLTTNVTGTLFTWTITPGAGNITGFSENTTTPADLIDQTLILSGVIPDSITYHITPHANGCDGITYDYKVRVNPFPEVTNHPMFDTICDLNSPLVTLQGTCDGTTYSWIAQLGSGNVTGFSSGAGDLIDQILDNQITTPGEVQYVVTPSAYGCPGEDTTFYILVNPTAQLTNTTLTETICSGETTAIELLSNVSPVLYTWYCVASSPNLSGYGPPAELTDSLNQTVSNTGSTIETVTYHIIPVTDDCNGDTTQFVLTVNPVADLTTSPLSQEICNNTSPVIHLTSTVTGTTFSWTAVASSPNITGFADGTGILIDQTLSNSGYTIETVTYTITPEANSCFGADYTYTVTVFPTPDLSNTPLTQDQCNNLNTNITLTSNVATTLFTWTASGSSANITGFSDNTTPADLIDHTLVNSGTNIETVEYTITPQANGCDGNDYTFTVTVYPTPDLSNTPLSQNQCNNLNTNIGLTSNVTGTQFTWTASGSSANITGFSDSPSPGTLIDHTLVNSGFDVETVTYEIIPEANGCNGANYTYTVTVFPTPDLHFSPASQTLCSGETSSIALSSSVLDSSFTWTAVASSANITGFSNDSGDTIIQTLSNSGTTIETVTYTVTPSANGCDGPALDVIITINPVTHITSAPLFQDFCSGGTANLSLTADVTGTTFSWIAIPQTANLSGYSDGTGDLINQTLTNTGYTIDTVYYTITPTANGCDGPDSVFKVAVYPIPDVSNDPMFSELCNGTSTNITLLSNVAGANFSWTATPSSANIIGWGPGSGTLIDQLLTNTGFNVENVTYHIIPTANGCTGSTYDFVATVVSEPDVYFVPPTPEYCNGETTDIQVISHVPSATFTWTAVGSSPNVTGYADGTGPLIAQTLANSGSTIETVTYTATPTAFGCPGGIPDDVIVTVNPTTYINNDPLAQSICSESSTNFPLIATVTGTSYAWTSTASSPNLSGFSDDSGPVIAQAITNSGYTIETVTYTITPTANGCDGPDSLFVATVFPTPDLSNDPKDKAICSGESTNINLTSNISSTQFTWTADGSSANVTGFADQSTPSLLIDQTLINSGYDIETVVYHLLPEANGCDGLVTDYTVTVYPVPDLSNNPASTAICNGETLNIDLLSHVTGTTFTWTATASSPNISGYSDQATPTLLLDHTLTNSGYTIETVTYEMIPEANGCQGIPTNFVVTVYPTPDLSNTPPETAICNNTGPAVTLTSNVTNTLFTWTASASSPNITGFADQSTPTTLLNQTLSNSGYTIETVTYEITPHANGCDGNVWTYTVTVYPVPDLSNAPANQEQCNNTATAISLTSNVANTLFTWTTTASSPSVTGYSDNTTSPVDQIDQTLINPTYTDQTVTYHITPEANGCSGIIWDYTVTIHPTPDLSNFPATQSQCNELATAINLTSNVANTTFTWRAFTESSNLSGFSDQSAPGVILIDQTITNSGFTVDTLIYRLLPEANSCSGDSVDYRVIVFPTPDMSNDPPESQVCNSTPTGVTLTSHVDGTTFTWIATPSSANITGWSNNSIPTTSLNQTLVNNGLLIETVTYTMTPSANGCIGPDTNYVVTVVQSPDVYFNPPAETICSEGTSNIEILSHVPGTTYEWTTAASSANLSGFSDGNGDLIAQSVTNSGTSIETVTYTVSPTAWGCPPGVSQDVTLTVNPEPAITNTDTTFAICSATYTGIIPQSSVTGSTYEWTATGSSANVTGFTDGSGLSIVQQLTNTGYDLETVIYTTRPLANACYGDARSFVVTVYPVADAYYDPSGEAICSGETCNLNILSNVLGSTYTWTASGSSYNVTGYSNGSGDLIQQNLVNQHYALEYVTYTVTPTANGCTGTTSQVVVDVNPWPVVDYSLCTDILTTTDAQPIILKGGIPLDGTYSGTGVTGGTFYPGIAGVGTHTILYTYTNNMGCTRDDSIQISVMDNPMFLCGDPLTDVRDGQIYPTVQLGTQCWMAANLNYGNVLATSQVQRDNCISEKYCLNDNPANCTDFGGLYQWNELMLYRDNEGAQGFCPPGWHVPTEVEWTTLFNQFVSSGFAGNALKTSGYSGFDAMVEGMRFHNSVWKFMGNDPVLRGSMFWSSSAHAPNKAWAHGMNEVVANDEYTPSVSFYPSSRIHAFFIRCIRD
jgi:uncharacterized protein (TIGR02145 family)